MTKSFRDLRKKLSPKAQKQAAKKTADMIAAMPLHELRQARRLSQEQLASALEKKQGSISRLEKQTDMYISTLRRYIEAMGGTLDIIARFPEGDVHVSQFEAIGDDHVNKDKVKAWLVSCLEDDLKAEHSPFNDNGVKASWGEHQVDDKKIYGALLKSYTGNVSIIMEHIKLEDSIQFDDGKYDKVKLNNLIDLVETVFVQGGNYKLVMIDNDDFRLIKY
ncbi:XRE family transcriptional regulator [Candidiatus Paracoxiella cheracis]|uniref:XRE family transcriptional regulator n=1 Tax=Candidiatus Paracoxiella cheracis TaxID=3405120 RepID=UPI003BF53ABE